MLHSHTEIKIFKSQLLPQRRNSSNTSVVDTPIAQIKMGKSTTIVTEGSKVTEIGQMTLNRKEEERMRDDSR
ncbi:hypothetical protein FCM35_KLT18643 [Carex littledalei]|uniref:Uncharacterized protein n=1 Tax=Carex littledalei TaxID=544730 RepID=A0A833RF67_9POAL|nr:hypothetical protein FCM35_KLT18643 [Carex littledalei]